MIDQSQAAMSVIGQGNGIAILRPRAKAKVATGHALVVRESTIVVERDGKITHDTFFFIGVGLAGNFGALRKIPIEDMNDFISSAVIGTAFNFV